VRYLGARCLQVNGLYRHGYLIAPAMLDVVLQLMNEGRSALAEDMDCRVADAPRNDGSFGSTSVDHGSVVGSTSVDHGRLKSAPQKHKEHAP
jgi:hypothetical protein